MKPRSFNQFGLVRFSSGYYPNRVSSVVRFPLGTEPELTGGELVRIGVRQSELKPGASR